MVDFTRPLFAQHLDDASRRWPARAVGDDEGAAPAGCTFVAFGEGADRNVIAFRATGFPESGARWRLQNVDPDDVRRATSDRRPLDLAAPLQAVHADTGAVRAARVRQDLGGEGDGVVWVTLDGDAEASRMTLCFDSATGRRPLGRALPHVDDFSGWSLRNVQLGRVEPAAAVDHAARAAGVAGLAVGAAPVDWSRPLEVVFDTGDVAPAVVAELIDSGDRGRRVVRWGPGLLAAFDASGAQVAVTVRNAAPFDPRRPFRTRDGRPAELIAVAEPPLGETAVLARVASPRAAGGLLGQYRADGRVAHGHGTPGDRLGADDLVNDPPLSDRAPAWDPHRPTRTRDGRATRALRVYDDGGATCDVLDAARGVWEHYAFLAGGRFAQGAPSPRDLVNFDPDAEARAAFEADPLLTVGGQPVTSLKVAPVSIPRPDGSAGVEVGLVGDVSNGPGSVRARWTLRGLYLGRDGRGVASAGAHALDLRRIPTDADRAALPGRDDPND